MTSIRRKGMKALEKLFTRLTIVLALALLAACGGAPAEPTEAPSPVPPTDTAVPPTDTPVPTDTPEPTATSTETPLPTDTPTPTPDLAATAAFEETQAAEAVLGLVGEELAKYQLTTDSGYLAWAEAEPYVIVADNGPSTIYEPIDDGVVYSE